MIGGSTITGNIGAGGGGGGGGGAGHHGGIGGEGVGGIWNAGGGVVDMTAAAYAAMTGNAGGSGGVGQVGDGGNNSGVTSPAAHGNINTGVGTIDLTYVHAAPAVSSIAIAGTSPNNASTEQFTVTFSEAVTGVSTSDFTLTDSGSVAGSITSVSGSGTTYTITVGSVTGDGTMRLDLAGTGAGIADSDGVGIATGYTSGQIYTIQHSGPSISSMTVPANGTYVAGQKLEPHGGGG